MKLQEFIKLFAEGQKVFGYYTRFGVVFRREDGKVLIYRGGNYE